MSDRSAPAVRRPETPVTAPEPASDLGGRLREMFQSVTAQPVPQRLEILVERLETQRLRGDLGRSN